MVSLEYKLIYLKVLRNSICSTKALSHWHTPTHPNCERSVLPGITSTKLFCSFHKSLEEYQSDAAEMKGIELIVVKVLNNEVPYDSRTCSA